MKKFVVLLLLLMVAGCSMEVVGPPPVEYLDIYVQKNDTYNDLAVWIYCNDEQVAYIDYDSWSTVHLSVPYGSRMAATARVYYTHTTYEDISEYIMSLKTDGYTWTVPSN